MFGINISGSLGHAVNQGAGVPWSGFKRRLMGGSIIARIKQEACQEARKIIEGHPYDDFARRSRLKELHERTQQRIEHVRGKSLQNLSKPIGRERDFRYGVLRARQSVM